MDGVVIREAVPSDLAQMLDLYRHLNPDDPELTEPTGKSAWKAILETSGVTVFVAEFGGQLRASCLLIITPNLSRGARSFAVIENVVTHSDVRRRGLGKAVLGAAFAKARAAGCYKVMLMTGSRRESTLRFYESAGFKRGEKTAFLARFD